MNAQCVRLQCQKHNLIQKPYLLSLSAVNLATYLKTRRMFSFIAGTDAYIGETFYYITFIYYMIKALFELSVV